MVWSPNRADEHVQQTCDDAYALRWTKQIPKTPLVALHTIGGIIEAKQQLGPALQPADSRR